MQKGICKIIEKPEAAASRMDLQNIPQTAVKVTQLRAGTSSQIRSHGIRKPPLAMVSSKTPSFSWDPLTRKLAPQLLAPDIYHNWQYPTGKQNKTKQKTPSFLHLDIHKGRRSTWKNSISPSDDHQKKNPKPAKVPSFPYFKLEQIHLILAT